jgi:DNA-binding IclR family transcriptional regulator
MEAERVARATNREAGIGTQSVERALAVLQAFTDEHPERRISELAQLTGLGQSTVSRLVGALESLGFLIQDSRSGLYRPGPAVVSLASVALNQSVVHQQARQIAQDLAQSIGLGANVSERQGSQLFYLCHFEGRQAPRSFTLVGRSGPLHATAMGKALLFDYSAAAITHLLGAEFPRYTPKTICRASDLHAAIAQARSQGYATEVEELAFGRACVAAPVRDRSGKIVAALSVSGSLSAMDLGARQGQLGTKVIEQADQISVQLGFNVTSAPLSTPA